MLQRMMLNGRWAAVVFALVGWPGCAERVTAQDDMRTREGLQLLYDFSGTGTTIIDRSGVGQPLNLRILNPKAVRRESGVLHVRARASIRSEEPATKVVEAVKKSGEFTMEAWIQSATKSQSGPARIVTISKDSENRDFTLGQQNARFDARFRSGSGNSNGLPSIESSSVLGSRDVLNRVTHVVYVRDRAGKASLFVNGVREGSRDVTGNLSGWQNYHLALADELNGDRMWLGSYHFVAIYSRAFQVAEVKRHFQAGHRVGADANTDPPRSPAKPARVEAGLQAIYDFRESGGDTIHDRSGLIPPFDLKIDKPDEVQLGGGVLRLKGKASVVSSESPKRLLDAVRRSGSLSIEAWVRPDGMDQKGPARIVTFSENQSERNFTLGQEGNRLEVRLRTTQTSRNGIPAVQSKDSSLGQSLVHVVYTRGRSGRARIYLNGQLSSQSSVAGAFSNWNDRFRLALGNEISGDRPWRGELRLVAIYSRELLPGEIAASYAAGPDGQVTNHLAKVNDKHSEFFENKVAPILSQRCIECHDSASREGGLDLSRKKSAFSGGDSGNAIVAGKANESLLRRLVETDAMPHDRPPLTGEEKEVLEQWINDGAVWTIDYVDPSIYRHVRESENWVQRLTVPEYIASVHSVFGIDISSQARELLPEDKRADGFRNTAYNLNVDLKHVESYARLAEIAVNQVDVGLFAKRFSKSKRLTDDHMRGLIAEMGKWVLRGPLDNDEVVLYRGISTTVASAGGDFREAVSMVLEAMLQSPRFIYRIEKQVGDGTLWPVDEYELASRMSYILWGAAPDQQLLAAADSGALLDPDKLVEQIDRMLADPRAQEQSKQFVIQWLSLNRLDDMSPDAGKFPQWSSEIAADMHRETVDYFLDIVWKQKRSLADLMNAQFTYVTPRLAEHYGMNPPPRGESRVDLREVPSRGGLLTHGSVLAIGGDDASMVTRGLFVLNDLLFGEVGDPPPGLDITPVATSPGRTHRAIATDRIESASCGGCHARFEPLAFGLEKFDGLGTFQEKDEHGNPLREDGEIFFPGESKPVVYETSAEMMDLLAKSDRVKECLTRKVVQFSLGRPLFASDAAAVRAIHEASQLSGGTYQSLLREIILSDLVQLTRTEPSPSVDDGESRRFDALR